MDWTRFWDGVDHYRRRGVYYARKNPQMLGFAAIVIFVSVVSYAAGGGCASDEVIVADEQVLVRDEVLAGVDLVPHVVQRGEFLHAIAEEHGVWWEEVLFANESYLRDQYETVCANHGRRNDPNRRGLFCNDRYNRPYGNTLMPGWELMIPIMDAPAAISIAVSQMGERVALVIDGTGSMDGDQDSVVQLYMGALREQGRILAGVWIYADGEVTQYDQGAVRSWSANELRRALETNGDMENTYGALRMAERASPDSVILITDERGDDWPSVITFDVPVVATCLPDQHSGYQCAETLRELAFRSGGRYVAFSD